MMFELFEAVADRVRRQADDYAEAQARIGSCALSHVMEPFGMTGAIADATPVTTAAGGIELRSPRLRTNSAHGGVMGTSRPRDGRAGGRLRTSLDASALHRKGRDMVGRLNSGLAAAREVALSRRRVVAGWWPA